MRDSECKNGAKVICAGGTHSGKIGHIYDVLRNINGVEAYRVQSPNGYPISTEPFRSLETWDIAEQAPSTLKSATHQPSKECPCGIARMDCDYHRIAK